MINKIISSRLKANKNWLLAITGQTGSGKSYAALSIASRCDPNYTIDNIVFSPLDFMKRIRSDDLKEGSIIVFDEAGVGMSNRDWQSQANKLLGFVLETFRHRNLVVIFTMPNLNFLDKKGRQLLHCHGVTAGIDIKKGVCDLKLFRLEENQTTGKVYRKYYRLRVPDSVTGTSQLTRIKTMGVRKPVKKVIAEYEAKKEAYTTALYTDVLAQMEGKGKQELTELQTRVLELCEAGLVAKGIGEQLNKDPAEISKVIRGLKKKGIEFKKIYENNYKSPSYYEVSVPTGITRA